MAISALDFMTEDYFWTAHFKNIDKTQKARVNVWLYAVLCKKYPFVLRNEMWRREYVRDSR